MAGSKSVAGSHKRFMSELGRSEEFHGSCERTEQNVMTQYVSLEVGSVHSRGVNGVTPVEGNKAHSKGLTV